MKTFRKISVLLAALVFCLILASCRQDGARADRSADDALDKAFSSGKLVLSEKTLPLPDPDTCEIQAPPRDLLTALLEPYPDEAEIREALKTGEVMILACSPDGKTLVGYVYQEETEERTQIPLIFSGNQVRMIYPSATRGVEDPYRNLPTYYSKYYYMTGTGAVRTNCQLGIGEEGLAWSPDGRYYYAGNYHLLYTNRGSSHYIVDTQTGEIMTLTSAPFSGGGSGIYSGCFSNDGQALYVYGFGGVAKLNLDTFEAALVAQYDMSSDVIPSLTMLKNGKMLAVDNGIRSGEKTSIDWIGQDGNIQRQEYPFETRQWAGRRVVYSPESGLAVIWQESRMMDEYRTEPVGGDGLYIFRPDEDRADNLDQAWFIDNDTGEAGFAPVADLFVSKDGTARPKEFDHFAYRFLDMELSPGGRYLALLLYRFQADRTSDPDPELKLLVIRLEDGASLAAENFDIFEDRSKTSLQLTKGSRVSSRAGEYLPILNWTEGGLVVVCDKTQLWQVGE